MHEHLKFLIFVVAALMASGCMSKNDFSEEERRDLLAEGAARVEFRKRQMDYYEVSNEKLIQFSNFSVQKKKLNMDGISFWRYTWRYTGDENLDEEKKSFKVYIAPTEDGIWIE